MRIIILRIKTVVFVSLLTMIGITKAVAQVFTVDNLDYFINDDENSVSVSRPINGTEAVGQLIIPSSVTYEGKSYPVTHIEHSAFYNCEKFTGTLVIPESVVYLGTYAFYGCIGLTSIIIGNSVAIIGVNAFEGTGWYLQQPDGILYLDGCCLGYKGDKPKGELIIQEGTRLISAGAFYRCSELTGSLTIPNSVSSIGNHAFYQCNGFNGVLVLSETLTKIESSVFEGCNGFNGNLVIPNSVISIGSGAFAGCTGFNGILSLSNSLKDIGWAAFVGCNGFKGNLTIPQSVTTIREAAFSGCDGFKGDLIIPNSVTSIESEAFAGCTGFNGVLSLSNSLKKIERDTFRKCSGFNGDLIIPNSVTIIESDAFENCNGFNGRLFLSNSLEKIEYGAFRRCYGFFGDLVLPPSLDTIRDYAFYDCRGFNGKLIKDNPNTVIGDKAFGGCNFDNLEKRFKYIGEFTMKGFGFDGTESVNAIAQYEYYKAPDDTRIFDGLFCFMSSNILEWSAFNENRDMLSITFEDIKKIYDEMDGMCFSIGRFSQNKQVGKWIWISKYQGSQSINVCSIFFNENGVPEGDFEMYHLYKPSYEQQKVYNTPDCYKRSYASGTIQGGVIVSIDYKEGKNIQIGCNGEKSYISKVSGHYNNEGYPIGQWSFSGSNYTDYGRNIVVVFDEEGNCVKNYRVDPTTGDKIGLSLKMPAIPIGIANEVLGNISNRFFRSTDVKWRQKNIRKYNYY